MSTQKLCFSAGTARPHLHALPSGFRRLSASRAVSRVHPLLSAMHAAESRTITDRSHTQRSADSDPHPNHTMHAGSAAIRFGCAAAGRRSRQGRQGAAQPPAAHQRRFSAPLVGALFGDGLTVRYALQLSWCGSLGAPLRRPEHAHGRQPRRCCSSPSCCCDGYEWALAALAATQACSLVGPCVNELCQRIHLVQVVAVGGCDGLVSTDR